jgi:hypothetical protein
LEGSFWIADSGKNTNFWWFSKFRNGVRSGEGAECSEHSSTRKMDENVKRVKGLILVKRRITVCEVANKLATCAAVLLLMSYCCMSCV